MRTNLAVRDMDLGAFNQLDGRRLEIVVDGLPLWGGSQLAVDTTMVSPLSRDGVALRGSANTNGKALSQARRRKERTYPELTGERGRARLVVLGVEVGGRWSAKASVFLRNLAAAKARAGSCCVAPSLAGVARLCSCSGFQLLSPGCCVTWWRWCNPVYEFRSWRGTVRVTVDLVFMNYHTNPHIPTSVVFLDDS